MEDEEDFDLGVVDSQDTKRVDPRVQEPTMNQFLSRKELPSKREQ